MKLSRPTAIGLISGICIIILSLVIYYLKGDFNNEAQYTTYVFYLGTVIYSQYLLFESTPGKLNFGRFFAEGFRTFIVITFLMVVFTWLFIYLHPEIKEEMARRSREDKIKLGNRTPVQIEAEVTEAKKKFITIFTSIAIFGYLMIGSLGSLIEIGRAHV
mgnify:CR=1 FL=1